MIMNLSSKRPGDSVMFQVGGENKIVREEVDVPQYIKTPMQIITN